MLSKENITYEGLHLYPRCLNAVIYAYLRVIFIATNSLPLMEKETVDTIRESHKIAWYRSVV